MDAQRFNETCTGRLQRQDRGADIAADLRVHAGRGHKVPDQSRGGRFAVGAGNGDERRIGRAMRALAAEQLDIADDFDAGVPGALHDPMRRRMRERHAGSKQQRGDPRPIGGAQIGDGDARGVGLGNALHVVVECDDVGATGQ